MNDIEELDVNDLTKVQKLITKLINKKKSNEQGKNPQKTKTKSPHSKKAKEKIRKQVAMQNGIKAKHDIPDRLGSISNPRKISSNNSINSDQSSLTDAQKAVKRNEDGDGRVAAYREKLHTGPRPNTFLDSTDYNEHKDDTKLDKLLSGKNALTKKRDPLEYLEVECSKCNSIFVTSANNVYKVGDELKAECNRCSSVKE